MDLRVSGHPASISVRIGDELMGGVFVELETEVRSAFYVAEDAFNKLEVGVQRRMHEEANLLYTV